ncbi:GspH/FimT family pseudopilin [Alkalilimnicola ehrlichii]|uniref:GspH/FimT family pseudopilin n=1 Tax=Alkalilimnicola ehrlichii TaxID=351052 RepID=UPI003BA0E0D9
MKRLYGFTLVELMVTIAVAAVLLTLAVPGFRGIVHDNRATSLANELTTAINLARSEAIRRGRVVSVCTDDWEAGWRVEVGEDCDATGDDVIRRWDAPATNSVIDAGDGETAVRFEALGGLEGSDVIEITFQIHVENCTGDRARRLRVSPGGHVGVERVECP